jgi:hypothetical protein
MLPDKQARAQLQRFGWMGKPRDGDFPDAPFFLRHRYFDVSSYYI